MINLLPPEIRQGYRYARINRRLAKWTVAFLAGIAGVIVITGAGLFYMNRSINDYAATIATTKAQLQKQDLKGVQQQVTDISNNLKLAVRVLSKEVLFSQLLGRLGSVTPPHVILTNLSIAQDQNAIDITAKASSYNAATQLQVNLADPNNQIFSQADIVSITCGTDPSNPDPSYPCTANIRALLADNTPFLFINAKNQGAAK